MQRAKDDDDDENHRKSSDDEEKEVKPPDVKIVCFIGQKSYPYHQS